MPTVVPFFLLLHNIPTHPQGACKRLLMSWLPVPGLQCSYYYVLRSLFNDRVKIATADSCFSLYPSSLTSRFSSLHSFSQKFVEVLRIRIRDPVLFWPLDPGSGIGFFLIPDCGSQTHIFESLLTIFLVILWKMGQIFFFSISKTIIFNYVKFVATKKGMTTNFFTPLFCCCFWIRDPRSEIWDPGWVKIRIWDPG
jgi:hypothetical protein